MIFKTVQCNITLLKINFNFYQKNTITLKSKNLNVLLHLLNIDCYELLMTAGEGNNGKVVADW